MPTRKIADLPEHERCMDPAHNPPAYQVFPAGVYEHECPSCGHTQRFTVRRPRYNSRWGDVEFSSDKLDAWAKYPEARIEWWSET